VSDFLLDTDVLIRCLRGIPDTLRLAQNLTNEGELHISAWSELEIMTLVQPGEEERTQDFLASFTSHPVTEAIAQHAASLLRERGASSTPLSFAEAIIASTAVHHNLTLVTYSPKNFQELTDLKIDTTVKFARRGGS
jgi:predicted nucleic acid-binding protein